MTVLPVTGGGGDAFGEQIGLGLVGRTEMPASERRGDPPIHLLRERRTKVARAQAGFDMAHGNTGIEGGHGRTEHGGGIALHEDGGRFRFGEPG
jgi:hypothetical protein